MGLGELESPATAERLAEEVPSAEPVAAQGWPVAPVRLPEKGAAPAGVLLRDAGHLAPGNPGNTGWACESEADVGRRLADAVAPLLCADDLANTLTRPAEALVDDDRRMEMAKAATWLGSLRSDSRAGGGRRRRGG